MPDSAGPPFDDTGDFEAAQRGLIDVCASACRADTGAKTESESLIAEVRQLRADVARLHADVARLHAAHRPTHSPHWWMKLVFKDLSTNPYTQYKVHMWGSIY
jgi:hypothetical protein